MTKMDISHSILSLKQQTQRIEKEYGRLKEKKQITYKGKPIKITAVF
jgi:hypothetical protein